MIYGRRFFEKNRQRLSKFEQQAERLQSTQRSMQSLYQQFQRRYAAYFLLAILGPFSLFVLPCAFFVQQNYEIFQKLAYDIRPELLNHLEREKALLFGLIVFTVVCSSLFCYWLTKKIMALIAGPLWALERHMKQVTLGDWSSQDFHIRSSDEFQSLASTYSYLYRSLRVHTQRELESLESLGLDPRDRQTYMVLKNLIELKRSQLGMLKKDPNGGIAAETSSSPSKRRAS
jgi:hypothetical protein